MSVQEYNWYKLDNAAKIFPAASSITATNVFRISARLFEAVSEELLQKALELALAEMPMFRIRLRKGIFWFYFEPNPLLPRVTELNSYPCRKIDRYTNNGYLFNLTYFGRYIHLEVFHALCDGTAALAFLTKILTHYLILTNKDELPEVIPCVEGEFSKSAKSEDSFLRMMRSESGKPESMVRTGAYNAPTTLLQNGEIKVIKGILPLAEVKAFAKSKNATITAALAGVLIYSLYLETFRYAPKNKPIEVCVPVNLRKIFPSQTMRNFFTSVAVGLNFFEKEYTLDETISAVGKQLEEELSEEKLASKVRFCVQKETNIFLRFFPLFLKNLGLKISFDIGEKGYTMVLSNLGKIQIPDEIKPYVERFEFLLSPTLNSRYKTSCCSYGNTLVYAFTSNAENTEVQRRFFTILRDNGIDVTISVNVADETVPEKENPPKDKKPRREKKAKKPRKGGGEQ